MQNQKVNWVKMHFFVTVAVLAVVSLSSARPQQQQLDPAYLRQYYAQIGQQTGAQGARSATPIFESAEPQQQYQQQGLKNVRIKSFKMIAKISISLSSSSQDPDNNNKHNHMLLQKSDNINHSLNNNHNR